MLTPEEIRERAEEQQQRYRDSCQYRRTGKTIEERAENGKWKKHSQYGSINAAKRTVRSLGLKSFTVR